MQEAIIKYRGEYRLIAAMLSMACWDLERYLSDKGDWHYDVYGKTAKMWIYSKEYDHTYPFSFAWCCRALDECPDENEKRNLWEMIVEFRTHQKGNRRCKKRLSWYRA